MCSSWCPLCFTQLSIYKLRLTDLESQDALCKMLLDASAGLADCRRIMSNIVVGEDTTWTQVQLCLDKAKPFVTAYKKHIQTARSLFLDSAYRCLHYTCICVSVCVCVHACHVDMHLVYLRIQSSKRDAAPAKKKAKTADPEE